MAATTLGAWASDLTYKVNLTIVNANHAIEGVSLDTPYQVQQSDIITTFCAAYPQFNTTEYDITIDNITTSSSTYSMKVEAGKIIIEAPSLEQSVFDNVVVTVTPKGESTAVSGWNENAITLSITIYHEQHNPNSTWESNDDIHFHYCNNTNGRCELENKLESAAHTYGTDPSSTSYYTCTVCDYVNNSRKPAHAHNYSSEWYYKGCSHTPADTEGNGLSALEGKHWHYCTNTVGDCDAKRTGIADHEYGTSQEGPAYYTCKVCGYVNSTRQSEGHTHSYSSDWTKDDTYHWHVCTATTGACNEPIDAKAAHIYAAVDNPATTTVDERYTCSTCGYVDQARKSAIEAYEANKNNPAWSWDYEIPFPFDATNISNDRKLKTEQAYTICLPYDLKLNGLKVYFMEKMSAKLVGFREQTITELPAFTPCVVIAAAVGNPLSMAGGKVKKTTDITDRKAVGDAGSILKGSLKYIAGADAKDLYIMQAADEENPQGSFKKIADDQGDYGNANPALHYCVLPQRAYLAVTASPSREILNAWFFDADGTTKVVDRLVIDEDAAPAIYDLQGRKVSNPQRGGLYIINGKKMIMK